MADWQLANLPPDDTQLAQTVESVFTAIHQEQMAGAEGVNGALPVEVRALRQADGWRVMLLLTPWMLARLYLPETAPSIEVPPDWQAEARAGKPYEVIGPPCRFTLFGGEQKAHLNYHPGLGHYLVLPIAQAMEKYAAAGEVFAEWNGVLATRDRVMAEGKRECPAQREMSRREFFTGG